MISPHVAELPRKHAAHRRINVAGMEAVPLLAASRNIAGNSLRF